MTHRATPRFWDCYRRMPADVQHLADRCCQLLLRDSRHPSLHFKRIGQFWSARVGLHYRALAIEENEVLILDLDRNARGLRHADRLIRQCPLAFAIRLM
jgi:hypothetical protein